MRRMRALFVIVIVSACSFGVAGAEPADGQRDLVRDLSVDLVLLDISRQIKGIATQGNFSDDETVRSAWTSAVDQVMSRQRMEAAMRDEFAAILNESERAALYEFVDSPFGRRVRKFERQAMQAGPWAEMVNKGKKLVPSLSDKRVALLAGILNGTGGRENSIAMGTHMMTAMVKGMKIGGLYPETVDDETLDTMIAEQKAIMVATVDDELPAILAFTYHPLTDRELDRYLSFLNSGTGGLINAKVVPAVQRVASAALTAFGIRFAVLCGKPVDESDL
ncbi:MAG: DUF2059 domain-containing protein [Pseudomonadota bacterium]